MASSLKNLSVYKDTPLNLNYPRIGIVVSEWNSEVTDALASGAINTLISKGISEQDINVKYVPGTFELALGAKYMIDTVGMDAVLCLGCVIQGETRHFDFICNASANAIATLNLESGVPVIFGVLTTDNQQQALDRSGGKHGNKGVEAAMAALKMISLNNTLFDEFDQELLEEFGED
jgi:6,7-dimethyl-8-ribityllumazine synthase